MRSSSIAVVAFLALAGVVRAEDAATEANEKELGKTSGERLLDDAVSRLRERFYDKKRGIDWTELAARHRAELRASASPHEAHGLVNRMLGELATSHLAVIEGDVFDRELSSEFQAKRTLRAACELVLLDGRLFVGSTYEDGTAERAGLRAGDEILEIDGAPASSSPRLEEAGHDPGLPGPGGFVLDVKTKDVIRLRVRRAANEPARAIELVPEETCMLDAARASIKLVERGGKKLARIHLWHFMTSRMGDLLADALTHELKSADALVLDVRGRGGHAGVVTQVLSNFDAKRPRWSKPVVALIDRGTRSAKEVFAWNFRHEALGKLVGERTAGAVIACTFERLFDGSVLMLPIMDARGMTKGESLEGKGVAPDVAVDVGPLPFRAGRDPIEARGEEVALSRLTERARFEYR